MRKTPPATLNIIIVSFLVWLASIVLPDRFGIDVVRYLGLHYWRSEAFNPLQLVTYIFMHDTHSFGHILCNMFGVWMFGRTVEELWGAKKFLFFYLFVGVGAGIIQELTWEIDLFSIVKDFDAAIAANSGESLGAYISGGDLSQLDAEGIIRLRGQLFSKFVTVGASGSLFGILLAFGWLFPQARMMLIFLPFIPIPSRVFVAVYAIFELIFGIAGVADGVAHFAHLGGLLFAAILLFIWKKKGKLYN